MGLVILDSEIPQCSNPLMQMTRAINTNDMRLFFKILAGIICCAALVSIAADTMILLGFSKGIQYAFNCLVVTTVFPCCLYVIMNEEERV